MLRMAAGTRIGGLVDIGYEDWWIGGLVDGWNGGLILARLVAPERPVDI